MILTFQSNLFTNSKPLLNLMDFILIYYFNYYYHIRKLKSYVMYFYKSMLLKFSDHLSPFLMEKLGI